MLVSYLSSKIFADIIQLLRDRSPQKQMRVHEEKNGL